MSLASERTGGPRAGQVVGIDVGATKTHLALASNGVVEFEQIVATSTWRTASAARNAEELGQLVQRLLGGVARQLPLGVGAHGCDSTEQCLVMGEELRKHFSGPVTVVNDAELMPLASGVMHGIGLVAGTGSIAAARDESHRLLTAGGWGWVLGDEGGAAGIVREAVRAVLAQLDRGERDDPLTKRLMRSCGVHDGPDLAMTLTRANSADAWGSHAPVVFAAAEEGSIAAQSVIQDAGRELAVLVQRLVNRAGRPERVVAGGAVIRAQQSLWEAFVRSMQMILPDVAVSRLDRAPVLGAISLAMAQPEGAVQHRRVTG